MYDIVKEIWKNPGAQYSPYPVWQWNESDTAENLVARLDSFHRKGIDGVIVSLLECGLTDELADKFITVLEAAKKRFMLVFIRDSFASAEEAIVAEEKRAGERVLLIKPSCERAETDEVLFSVYVKREGELLTDVKLGAADGYEECDVVLGYGRENKADILNPYTAENIIKNTLERYYVKLHEYFGSVIIGFNIIERTFTDKLTWSYGMDEDWMAAGGDVSSLVSLLIEPKVKKQRREAEFIYDKMLRAKIRDAYLAPIAKWCAEHGVGLVGGLTGESADLAFSAQFDVPTYRIKYDSEEKLPLGMKAVSDTARHRGVSHSAAELFGGVESVSPDEYMCELNRAFSCGASMIIPGEFTESMAENSPLWCEYRKASAYIKRMSWLNATGTNNPMCAVLCSSDYVPRLPAEKLYAGGYPFNYLTTDDLMNKAHIHDGEIHIDRYKYKVLLVDTRLRLDTAIVEKIGRFVTSDGLLYRGTDFQTFLEKHTKQETRFVPDKPTDDITFLHMTKSGCPFCAVINHKDDAVSGKLIVKYNFAADRFDPFTGKTEELSAEMTDAGFEYAVTVPEHSSFVVGFDPDSLVRIKESADDNLSLSEIVSLNLDGEACFTVREDTKKVMFSAEQANGIAAVKVNGEEGGKILFKPYAIDITKLTHAGENTVSLTLCGSEVKAGEKLCFGCKVILYRSQV